MVVHGYAVPFLQFSDAYAEKGQVARDSNVGIWQTDFLMPWDYRKNN
jgi:endonuclease YncB( thermonuclease family)